MSMDSGIITAFSGAIGSIPDGWVLCDGNNGTPDLRNRFIVGAGLGYAVGASGGAINHTHTFTGNGHYHDFINAIGIAAGTGNKDRTSTEVIAGTSNAGNGLPPYLALAFIMKT